MKNVDKHLEDEMLIAENSQREQYFKIILNYKYKFG